MKKSLILTFVFAAIFITSASAQNISRPSTDTPATEQKTDKASPTDAQPGTPTPAGREAKKGQNTEKGKANGEARSKRKGDNGKHKGHDKNKAKGKAKGHKKGDDLKTDGESQRKPSKGRTKKSEKSPTDATGGRKAEKQAGEN